MVQPKRKRTDLSTPAWLRDRWNKGAAEKDEMADVLQRVNRDKACRVWGWDVGFMEGRAVSMGFVGSYGSRIGFVRKLSSIMGLQCWVFKLGKPM